MKRNGTIPPNFFQQFLNWFCHPDYLEDIAGDLLEEYRLYQIKYSKRRSDLWYSWQVIRLFRPAMMKAWSPLERLKTQLNMLANYTRIGIRNLWKFKTSTAINLVGLSTGLAAFILIALVILDDLSYDQHHEHKNEVFRVTVKNFNAEGSLSRHWAFASAGHAPRIKEDFPEVTHAARFYPWDFPDLLIGEERFPQQFVAYTDRDVFDIFTFKFLIGDAKSAFDNMNALVISERSAIKLFGNDWREKDLLGKPIQLQTGENKLPTLLKGVYENMPDQQHFHFDYLAPFELIATTESERTLNNVGGNYNYLTYVRTVKGTKPGQMNEKGAAFFDKYVQLSNGRKASDYYDFAFQPLTDIHLRSNLMGEMENNGSIQQVYIFSVIGLLTLLIACINYINLATAKYSRRMKEIGVRKVIGANKRSLFVQYLTESFLVTILALVIGVLLVYFLLPYLNDFFEKKLTFGFYQDTKLFALVIGSMLGVGLLAGVYPAIYLSSKNVITSLKGKVTVSYQSFNFRSVLVTFQYVVALGLIFSLIVVNSQIDYIFNSNPGYEKEQMLGIPAYWLGDKAEVLKNEWLSHPNIEQVTRSSGIPSGSLGNSQNASFYQGDSAHLVGFRLPYVRVDEDYIPTFGLEIVAGENFQSYMDVDSIGYFILNEAATKELGFADPSKIIGRKMKYGGVDGRIYGVIKDFHFESIHSPIKPMLLNKTKKFLGRLTVKVKEQDMKNTLKFIEKKWAEIDPVNTIDYLFLDERFARQYTTEQKMAVTFRVLSGLIVLISCLGMLGLVSFIIEKKTKEIGIRKVLGANLRNLVWLITRNFLFPIFIATAVALPIGYWLMSDWLEQFAYRFNFGWSTFVLPVLLLVLITGLTIGYRTLVASLVNPVDCLQDE